MVLLSSMCMFLILASIASIHTVSRGRASMLGVNPLTPSRSARIFQEFKNTDMKYKNRVRSRISNLKDVKNPNLRRTVLCGNVSPERMAGMSAEVR